MFAVTRGYASTDDYGQGILSIQIRSDPTLIGIKQFTWLANSGFNPNHFIIVISGMTWALYTHNTRQYNHIKFEALSCGDIRGNKYTWPLEYTSPNLTPEAVAPTPTAISKNITLPASNVSISSISETSATSAQAAFSELYSKLSEISKVSSYFPTSDNVKVSGITNSRIYKNDITLMRIWAGRLTLKADTYLAGEILCNIGACEYSLRIPCQTSNGTNIILTYQKEGDVIINSTTTLNAEIDIIINISMPLK